jgi:hypothetical protein
MEKSEKFGIGVVLTLALLLHLTVIGRHGAERQRIADREWQRHMRERFARTSGLKKLAARRRAS